MSTRVEAEGRTLVAEFARVDLDNNIPEGDQVGHRLPSGPDRATDRMS